jgi:hypothetical protein
MRRLAGLYWPNIDILLQHCIQAAAGVAVAGRTWCCCCAARTPVLQAASRYTAFRQHLVLLLCCQCFGFEGHPETHYTQAAYRQNLVLLLCCQRDLFSGPPPIHLTHTALGAVCAAHACVLGAFPGYTTLHSGSTWCCRCVARKGPSSCVSGHSTVLSRSRIAIWCCCAAEAVCAL